MSSKLLMNAKCKKHVLKYKSSKLGTIDIRTGKEATKPFSVAKEAFRAGLDICGL